MKLTFKELILVSIVGSLIGVILINLIQLDLPFYKLVIIYSGIITMTISLVFISYFHFFKKHKT